MNQVLFDVTEAWDDVACPPVGKGAKGFANGIEFLYSGPNWSEGSTTDGCFEGFSYVPSLKQSDRIHIAGCGHFAFGQMISRIDMHVAINPRAPHEFPVEFRTLEEPGSGVITPSRIFGDVKLVGTGFAATSVEGGLVLFDGLQTQDLWFDALFNNEGCVDIALIPNRFP